MHFELPSGDNPHNFEPIAALHLAPAELGGGYRLAIMFNDNTSGRQLLSHKECLEGAWQVGGNLLPIRDHD